MRHSFLGPGLAAPIAGMCLRPLLERQSWVYSRANALSTGRSDIGGVCQNADLGADPVVPCLKSVSACCGDGQYLDAGVHRSREAQTRFKIKVYVGNKIDLVDAKEIQPLETRLREINSTSAIVRTVRCQIDPELLFGIGREKKVVPPEHEHQSEFESFTFSSDRTFFRDGFEGFADALPANVGM